MFWKTRLATALTLAATLAACSLDDLVPDGVLPIDDGASKGAKESMKVDGSSDARLVLKTGATLTLPKDAVDHDVMIGIERPADSKAVEFVESLKSVKAVASAPYVLTPHGTEFMKDVKLEIPVVANKGKELVAVYLKDESDREWKYLDTPTVEDDVATVTLKHFSVILLVDRARAGVDAEERDAGSEPAESDAGNDDIDAGSASGSEDAGSAPVDPVGETRDAGSASAQDAGTQGAIDAGQVAPPDASVSIDARVDDDAGHGGGQPDASASSDAGQAVDAGPAPDAAVDDSSAQLPPDTGVPTDSAVADANPVCEPTTYCETGMCGWYDDGCGGEMPCGACDQACDLYDAGLCPIGL